MTEIAQSATFAEQIADLTPEEALVCLEAMSRRVIQIGNERIVSTPLIENVPKPGRLGGQLASIRRTVLPRQDFYFYDPYHAYLPTSTQTRVDLVPLFPGDEFGLLRDINGLGHKILDTFDEGRQEAWAASIDREALLREYGGPHPLV